MGKNSEKKTWTSFLNTTLGPMFNTKPPNLGPVFNSTTYRYVYICLYIHIYRYRYRYFFRFLQVAGVSEGFSKRNMHFVFLFCWRKIKERKMMKNLKRTIKKNGELCFWVVVKKGSLLKWHFEKIGKRYLCSEGKTKAQFR